MSLMVVAAGCGAPAPPPGTGGGNLTEGQCGRGLVVVQSDYQSTNVSLLARDGAVASSSFISSGSADPGLSAALSGDVAAPTARVTGDQVVLLDRFPASVVTWVDRETAEVSGQLDVRTGFSSNPQDVLEVGGATLISRYETNPAPGKEPFDAGGDLLIVDPAGPTITGRIDLSDGVSNAPEALPRPSRMVGVEDGVVVLLEAISEDFSSFADSRLALVDPTAEAIVDVLVLDGLAGCWGAVAEPPLDEDGGVTEGRVAVTCNGGFTADGNANVARAGVAVVSVQDGVLVEQVRIAASDIVGRSLGAGVAFADRSRLLVVGMGDEVSGEADALVALGLDGSAEVLLTSDELAFTLGEIRCLGRLRLDGDDAGCGTCWVADAERGVVHRLAVGAGLSLEGAIAVDDAIGLPPRYLGGL